MHIFISHSSKEFSVAEKICKFLEDNEHTCFLAPRDIRSGHVYAQELIEGIDNCDLMLVLLSEAANESPHVLREIERAVSKKIAILVYRLEEVTLNKSMEYFLMTNQWIQPGKKDNYQEILNSIDSCHEMSHMSVSETTTRTGVDKYKWLILVSLGIVVCIVLILSIYNGSTRKPVNFTTEEVITIAPGDTIVFGTYRNTPIEWRVLKISADGKEAVIVTKDIITMKAFDAAESGKYNWYEGKDYWGEDISQESLILQHQLRGSNSWKDSNIRCWLNASEENVEYLNGIPKAFAMSEQKNGYDKEPGFLSSFTIQEQSDILETELTTDGMTTKDKVFLLSKEELQWFYEANVSIQAIPTQAAREQDMTDWYENYSLEYGVEDYPWWLRDSEGLNPYEANIVCNSLNDMDYKAETVGLEGYGIRPAMRVKADSEFIQKK